MHTIGIILTKFNTFNIRSIERMLIEKSNKVVLIFIKKEKWFFEEINKKNINVTLNEADRLVRSINRRAIILKIVLFGDDSYKLKKCFSDLKIDFFITFFNNKKRSSINRLFKNSIIDKICEDLQLPVLITHNK